MKFLSMIQMSFQNGLFPVAALKHGLQLMDGVVL